MSSNKFRTEDSTASGGFEVRVFGAHQTVKVTADQTKFFNTSISSTSVGVSPESVGSATVPTDNIGISVIVNVDPTRGLLSAANRVLSGEPARKGPDPETR